MMLLEGSRLRVVPLLQMFLFTEAKVPAGQAPAGGAGIPAAASLGTGFGAGAGAGAGGGVGAAGSAGVAFINLSANAKKA